MLASAVQPMISATPPNGVTQPSQRAAPPARAKRLPLNSTIPTAKLQPATKTAKAARGDRDDREQCRSMDHTVERAGAQQFGGFRIVGEMGGEGAGHHRQGATQPGDRQPYPDHRAARLSRRAA